MRTHILSEKTIIDRVENNYENKSMNKEAIKYEIEYGWSRRYGKLGK